MQNVRQLLLEEASGNSDGGGAGGGSSSGGWQGGGSSSSVNAGAGASFGQLIGSDGRFSEGWVDKLPGEYDAYKATLANFKDFNGLSKALVDNMQAARARTDGMVRVPGEKATPEERKAFNKAMGVPDDPKGYGLQMSGESLPEGMAWDQGFADDFSNAAHSLGLTPTQVQGLAQWHQQRMVQEQGNYEHSGEEEYAKQQQELRSAFGGQYEKRLVDARRVAATLGLDPDSHPIFYRADTVVALTKVADLLSEDKLVSAGQVAQHMSPEAQAKDIMANPNHADYAAYNDPGDARHKEVVARVNGLFQRAYPR